MRSNRSFKNQNTIYMSGDVKIDYQIIDCYFKQGNHGPTTMQVLIVLTKWYYPKSL